MESKAQTEYPKNRNIYILLHKSIFMEERIIPLNRVIQTHPAPQEKKILQFMELMKRNGIDYFPPIFCEYSKAEDLYYVIDGTHTSIAASRIGYSNIESELREVELTDKSQLSCLMFG